MGESPFLRCSRFQKLCRMLLGFLFFAMTLMPLVSSVQLRRSVRTRCLRKNCHPVLGQAVNQSAELRSALVFFLAALLRQ